MTFYMRNYSSDEKFDIAKFMQYEEGVFDVINSPFLEQVRALPIVDYYYVNNGFHEIDLIASDYYGDSFLAYLIQYFNGDFRESFPENTVLNMFSLEDLEELYHTMSTLSNLEERKEEE